MEDTQIMDLKAQLAGLKMRIHELERERDEWKEDEKLMRGILRQLLPEYTMLPFICGHAGEKTNGLPETILVCPAYGADIQCTTAYRRVDK